VVSLNMAVLVTSWGPEASDQGSLDCVTAGLALVADVALASVNVVDAVSAASQGDYLGAAGDALNAALSLGGAGEGAAGGRIGASISKIAPEAEEAAGGANFIASKGGTIVSTSRVASKAGSKMLASRAERRGPPGMEYT
jgi:hypothetical protein